MPVAMPENARTPAPTIAAFLRFLRILRSNFICGHMRRMGTWPLGRGHELPRDPPRARCGRVSATAQHTGVLRGYPRHLQLITPEFFCPRSHKGLLHTPDKLRGNNTADPWPCYRSRGRRLGVDVNVQGRVRAEVQGSALCCLLAEVAEMGWPWSWIRSAGWNCGSRTPARVWLRRR
ncbi:hypothetical protein SGPA1_40640 [Streptomyces misionensis JCM 4497]